MKPIKQASNNEIGEALNALGEICHVLARYSHIEDVLSPAMVKAIDKEHARILKEHNRREDNF